MLVAIEGIDGAGKRTQASILVQRAITEGYSAAVISFPRYRDTFFGAAVQEMLHGNFGTTNDARLIGLLFAGDRFETLEPLREDLATYDLVVADRYVSSNLAYQAARSDVSKRSSVISWLMHVEYEVFGMPRADLNILLDVPVDVAGSRLASRPEQGGRVANDLFEADLGLLERCRSCYLSILETQVSWAAIPLNEGPAILDAAEIGERVWQTVSPRLGRIGVLARRSTDRVPAHIEAIG